MLKSGYSIARARPHDVPQLAAIELAAAELLRGHAPDSIVQETTDDDEFRAAQTAGRLWVALDVDPRHGRRGLGTALAMLASVSW
jgi:hypothetical protein